MGKRDDIIEDAVDKIAAICRSPLGEKEREEISNVVRKAAIETMLVRKSFKKPRLKPSMIAITAQSRPHPMFLRQIRTQGSKSQMQLSAAAAYS